MCRIRWIATGVRNSCDVKTERMTPELDDSRFTEHAEDDSDVFKDACDSDSRHDSIGVFLDDDDVRGR